LTTLESLLVSLCITAFSYGQRRSRTPGEKLANGTRNIARPESEVADGAIACLNLVVIEIKIFPLLAFLTYDNDALTRYASTSRGTTNTSTSKSGRIICNNSSKL
jgi:hypothetical protein